MSSADNLLLSNLHAGLANRKHEHELNCEELDQLVCGFREIVLDFDIKELERLLRDLRAMVPKFNVSVMEVFWAEEDLRERETTT